MLLRRVTLVGSAAFLLSLGFLAAAQERAQFRSGVELVQLEVVVLDGKRQPVSGLQASDFTVLDNGAETPIVAFTPVELTRPRANEAVWSKESPPDVATNQVGEEEGRLVVILMDRSIPLHEPTATARKIATAAVNSLGPYDLAAVVSTNNNAVQTATVQNLTSDRERLLRAINAGDPSTGFSAEAEAIMNKTGFQLDALNDPRCLCGLCVHDTIARVAEAVQSTPRRRKVLLFIGSNLIWQTSRKAAEAGADTGCETRLKDARNAMLAAIDRANLTVHSIDPQGLVNNAPQSQASGMNRAPGSALEAIGGGIQRSLSERNNLSVLPERTGGRTIVGKNAPEDTVSEILHETDAYYVLGIARATSTRTDATRSVEVKVGRKGLRVVAQRLYVGQPTSKTAAAALPVAPESTLTDEALTRLLPRADVPLALAVTPFASQDGNKPALRINVDAGGFARSDGADVPLEVAIIATDHIGRAVASARQASTIAVKRPVSGAPVEVNLQSLIDLPPGDYGVRVAVSDSATARVASVFTDVTVPSFDHAPLSLSGVNVERTTAKDSIVPTTRRAFKRNEQVRAVFQIYQGTARTEALAPVTVRVRILDPKGTAIRDQSVPFAESAFKNRRADAVITLPLAKLPAGEYLLKLDATANRQASGHSLRFMVLD